MTSTTGDKPITIRTDYTRAGPVVQPMGGDAVHPELLNRPHTAAENIETHQYLARMGSHWDEHRRASAAHNTRLQADARTIKPFAGDPISIVDNSRDHFDACVDRNVHLRDLVDPWVSSRYGKLR